MGCILVEKIFSQNQHEHDTELHSDIFYTADCFYYPFYMSYTCLTDYFVQAWAWLLVFETSLALHDESEQTRDGEPMLT